MNSRISFFIFKAFFLLNPLLFFSLASLAIANGPFPVKGEIYDGKDQKIGLAHVYPKYVEIYDMDNQRQGKVGIMVEEGLAKLFLVREDDSLTLVGHTSGGKVFDAQNKIVGSYFWTPTWSFVYNLKGVRQGKVKCIAWPRVCAAGVSGYLLNLFEGEKNDSGKR